MSVIIYQKFITRADLKANRHCIYVFGDNVERRGFGGQAKEMRGEPNAMGIATKRRPGTNDDDFFVDGNVDDYIAMDADIRAVFRAWYDEKKTLILPLDGIGTGMSQMPLRCPKFYNDLFLSFSFEEFPCPWPRFDIKPPV